MRLELFSAGCRLCERTESLIRSFFPEMPLQVHKASECVDGSCCELAGNYGVKAVPTLVADGKIVCIGVPDELNLASLRQLLLVGMNLK